MQVQQSSASWDSLTYKIQPWIHDAVISMGYTSMTPVQASTIPLLSQNKDVVVEAVTGSGKTAAFVIPVLEKICRHLKEEGKFAKGHFGAIVVSPTRELASQIQGVFDTILGYQNEEDVKIETQLLVGSVGSVREDLHTFFTKRPQILVGTPGRLLDFLNNQLIKTKSCDILILDEADKLLDISFLGDIQAIVRQLPRQRRTGLFSATISSAGSDVFKTGMTNPVKVSVKSNALKSSVPTSLSLFYGLVDVEMKFKILFELLLNYRYKKVIVYFPTCVGVSHFYGLFNALLKKSSKIDNEEVALFSLHGKLMAKPRLRTLSNFTTSSVDKSILFTTDVAARGLDIPEVDLVIQLDPPTDSDVFLHRCGRTGRANKVGKAVTMISKGREEDYIDFMAVKNVTLKEIELPIPDKESCEWFDKVLKEWMYDDRLKFDQAVKSYVGFVRYYSKHIAASIFRLSSLDYVGLCKMYGLARIPKMPENKYIENFPKDGWLDTSVDFDTYAYKDAQKEELRLHELKTEKKRLQNKARAEQKREQAKKNSSWSDKTGTKETKQERREKAKRRREAVEREIEEAKKNEESEDSEAEVDWKDLVRSNKKQKKGHMNAVQGSFDDL